MITDIPSDIPFERVDARNRESITNGVSVVNQRVDAIRKGLEGLQTQAEEEVASQQSKVQLSKTNLEGGISTLMIRSISATANASSANVSAANAASNASQLESAMSAALSNINQAGYKLELTDEVLSDASADLSAASSRNSAVASTNSTLTASVNSMSSTIGFYANAIDWLYATVDANHP